MTFNSFYEVYQNDLQNRIRQNTWVTKSSIIEKKILPYFGDMQSTRLPLPRKSERKPVSVIWMSVVSPRAVLRERNTEAMA